MGFVSWWVYGGLSKDTEPLKATTLRCGLRSGSRRRGREEKPRRDLSDGAWLMQSAGYLGLFGAASLETFESAFNTLVRDRKTELGAHVLGDGTIAHTL
jgi:hypothetical protein